MIRKPVGYRALIEYNHNRRILGYVVLSCQTDFVGKTPDFINLGRELAMQVVGGNPQTIGELLSQEYLKDTTISVQDYINRVSAKVKENIEVQQIHRLDVGGDKGFVDPELEKRAAEGKH